MRRYLPAHAAVLRLLIGVVLCLPLAAGAQPAATSSAAAAASTAVAITHHVLRNGLELLLMPEPACQLVAVQTWYRVGSRDETAETEGYAHLFEHLMVTGTDSVPDFNGELARLGGHSRSAVWPDVTFFGLDVPAEAWRRALEIEADRMVHLALDPGAIEVGVEAIGTKLAGLAENAPQHFIDDHLRALAFAGHPYANATLGAPGTLQPVTPASCRAFYRRYYRPDNACVILVGGFDPDSVLAVARDLFEPLAPPAAAPRAPLPPLPPPQERHAALDLGLAVPSVVVAYPIPGESAPAHTTAAWRLLATYLDGPGRQRWTRGLLTSDGRPEVAQLGVDLVTTRQAGLLVVTAALLEAARAPDVDRQIRAALGPDLRLAFGVAGTSQPSAADLAALRDQVRFEALNQRRTAAARGIALGIAHLLRGDDELYEQEAELLAAVTWQDLVMVAADLEPARAVTLTLTPGP